VSTKRLFGNGTGDMGEALVTLSSGKINCTRRDCSAVEVARMDKLMGVSCCEPTSDNDEGMDNKDDLLMQSSPMLSCSSFSFDRNIAG